AHTKGKDVTGLLNIAAWQRMLAGMDWRKALKRRQDAEEIEAIRLCTSRGRPFGTARFISKAEKVIGRRLHPLPPGRPRKTEAKSR
ncbi:MAG TPA: hypothetical protein VLH60_00340, partial [Sedimentisphaerales bacterium]|nr:hypothetical protein [Sedimentisphaerales bacterium]